MFEVIDWSVGQIPAYIRERRAQLGRELELAQRDQARAQDAAEQAEPGAPWPETKRERDLRAALETLVELAEDIEQLIGPRSELATFEVWAAFERAAVHGREALNHDDCERGPRLSHQRRRDLAGISTLYDQALATGAGT